MCILYCYELPTVKGLQMVCGIKSEFEVEEKEAWLSTDRIRLKHICHMLNIKR